MPAHASPTPCRPAAAHLPPAPCCAGELVPMGVKQGDKVLLPDYGGTSVKLEDKE